MLAKVCIKRPVTTIMVVLIVALAGIIGYSSLSLQMMPEVSIPIAVVSTSYTGAGPEEIEELITKPIENAMASVSNVDTITSTSASGSSMVMVQFVDGTDIDTAAIDMREKIDRIKAGLPTEANDPMVLKIDMNAQPISVGVTSEKHSLTELNTLIEDTISNNFEKIEGVSSVDITGGIEDEIEIVVNPEKLQGYGLTIAQISQTLAIENKNYPSGTISQGNTDMQIRAVGQFQDIDEIRQLLITSSTGAMIHLSDVATVEKVQKDVSSFSIINGKRGIVLAINKQSEANIVDITEKINKTMGKVSQKYPDLKLTMLTNTADYIEDSISNVTSTAFQAAALAVLILLLFLKDPKTSLIIGVSIPTSILATFAMMYMAGMTLNVVSMGGIAIGIGMLVDNSVVVLENIFKKWKSGMSPKDAALEGTNEVGMAVMASTLTSLAVFVPLLFVKGTIGQLFKDLSLTICFALAASLVVSVTFVPMACAKVLRAEGDVVRPKKGMFSKILDGWGNGLDALDRFYRRVLETALHHKKKTTAIVIAVFIGTLCLVPVVGMELMAQADEGTASITIELPKGSVLEETEKIVDQVVNKISDLKETELIYISVGGSSMGMGAGSEDTASIMLNLVSKKDRKRSTEQVCDEIKQRVATIAGAEITVSASANAMGSLGGADVSFIVQGDDNATLRAVSKNIEKILENTEGLKDITTSDQDSVPEANVKINRANAARYGVSTSTISSAIRTAATGTVASTYKVNGTETDIRIRYDKDRVAYINDLRNITVNSSSGVSIPITEVADIVVEDSAVAIKRQNQQKTISIEASTDGIDANTAKERVKTALDAYAFPEGYSYSFDGTTEMMQDSFSSFGLALVIAVILVYMIMASQFESLIHPFILMFTMPLAITGGILGLFLTGNPISITAMMGFIMLVGTVVNNGIVLVDYANQLMEKNPDWTADQALIVTGPDRLRPILMTTLTTVLGMLPLALAMGEGSESMKPLAIVDIFGLTLSTIITLVFIPVLYSWVDSFRNRTRKKRKNKKLEEKKNKNIEKNNKKDEKVETLV
jgi:HAE1 family hydrophobic/amphiphilic exporter-1